MIMILITSMTNELYVDLRTCIQNVHKDTIEQNDYEKKNK